MAGCLVDGLVDCRLTANQRGLALVDCHQPDTLIGFDVFAFAGCMIVSGFGDALQIAAELPLDHRHETLLAAPSEVPLVTSLFGARPSG